MGSVGPHGTRHGGVAARDTPSGVAAFIAAQLAGALAAVALARWLWPTARTT